MPYLDKTTKYLMEDGKRPTTSGELNYAITMLLQTYMKDAPKFNYETLNAAYGAVQLAAAEFKRRIIDPYEDQKIGKNGDVYEPALLAKAALNGNGDLPQVREVRRFDHPPVVAWASERKAI